MGHARENVGIIGADASGGGSQDHYYEVFLQGSIGMVTPTNKVNYEGVMNDTIGGVTEE